MSAIWPQAVRDAPQLSNDLKAVGRSGTAWAEALRPRSKAAAFLNRSCTFLLRYRPLSQVLVSDLNQLLTLTRLTQQHP